MMIIGDLLKSLFRLGSNKIQTCIISIGCVVLEDGRILAKVSTR